MNFPAEIFEIFGWKWKKIVLSFWVGFSFLLLMTRLTVDFDVDFRPLCNNCCQTTLSSVSILMGDCSSAVWVLLLTLKMCTVLKMEVIITKIISDEDIPNMSETGMPLVQLITLSPAVMKSIFTSICLSAWSTRSSNPVFPIRHFAGNDEYWGSNQAAVALVISILPCWKGNKRSRRKTVVDSRVVILRLRVQCRLVPRWIRNKMD